MWILEHRTTKHQREFGSRQEAEAHLSRLGETIGAYYDLSANTGNARVDKMLLEGLVKGDLYKILLPRISVDEFVPGDPDTDNIVVAFFLKGVPEATLPFKTFAEQSNGVLQTDYSDSEIIVGAQTVYVEFDRDNLDMEDIHSLMIQAAMLAGLEVEDFTITLPITDEKIPYTPQTLKEYFISRNKRKNEIAQKRALDRAAKEFEDTLRKAQNQKNAQKEKEENTDQQQAKEALVSRMAGVALTG